MPFISNPLTIKCVRLTCLTRVIFWVSLELILRRQKLWMFVDTSFISTFLGPISIAFNYFISINYTQHMFWLLTGSQFWLKNYDSYHSNKGSFEFHNSVQSILWSPGFNVWKNCTLFDEIYSCTYLVTNPLNY